MQYVVMYMEKLVIPGYLRKRGGVAGSRSYVRFQSGKEWRENRWNQYGPECRKP
jgi:hypothetical protein